MPDDGMYVPIQVGSAAGHFEIPEGTQDALRYVFDDEGDNISSKNKYYCELTGLYWGWKNLDCDYMGLVHYRRYLKGTGSRGRISGTGKRGQILSGQQALSLIRQLSKKDIFVILPKKRHYVIETLYSHYAHSHYPEDLDVTERVLQEFYPQYIESWHKVMKSSSSHMFNMCIMRKDILDHYCSWLFAVLEKTQERLDISKYSDFDKRVFGRISELLLDVWLTENNISYYELPMINLEGENWPRKIATFLRRKISPEH